MRLGELLVEDGHVSAEDLARIMKQQATEGGRLGSLLVLEGLIDVETLTAYLGIDLGIPTATGATFERCKRSAVGLFTPQQAAQFRAIPIVIQGQTLIVAVDDPHDMERLDAIHEATGYRVIHRVAPEIRIDYYLERFYGLPQPERFKALGDQRGSATVSDKHRNLPNSPLPGLPPLVAEPVMAPGPGPNFAETEELDLDAEMLIEELENDSADIALVEPRPEFVTVPVSVFTPTASIAAPAAPQLPPPAPLSAEKAINIIASTTQRKDVADAILGYAASIFEIGILLLIRDRMAFGWRGFGPNLDAERIESLLMPLDAASIFQSALASDDNLFHGTPVPGTLHTHWFKVLRQPTMPESCVVVTCSIGKRVVNLLYGQPVQGKDLSEEELRALRGVMHASSNAYVRLISRAKAPS